MIGQIELQSTFSDLIKRDSLPHFIILVGQKGSGKKLMCKWLASVLGAMKYNCGTHVEEIRTMISDAHNIDAKTLYVISDADTMSLASKNALLKITEEPPKNAYFVLTLTDLNNTLDTIKSRGSIFYMNMYRVQELKEFIVSTYSGELTSHDMDVVLDLCETPYEITKLHDMGVKSFWDYVTLCVDNIAEASGSNVFKMADKISFSDSDADKYDLRLFWKAFMTICSDRLLDNISKYYRGIQITSRYLQDIRNVSINKKASFDLWILAIREEWL